MSKFIKENGVSLVEDMLVFTFYIANEKMILFRCRDCDHIFNELNLIERMNALVMKKFVSQQQLTCPLCDTPIPMSVI